MNARIERLRAEIGADRAAIARWIEQLRPLNLGPDRPDAACLSSRPRPRPWLPAHLELVGAVEVGEPPIFADGFESGDTTAWTTVVF